MLERSRWVGPDHPGPVAHARQAGAAGMVTPLYGHDTGEAWPQAAIAARQREIEAAALSWAVGESIPVAAPPARAIPQRYPVE